MNAPDCKCKDGYFKLNNVCTVCDEKCVTCKTRSDYCIVCNYGIGRNLIAPSCGCNLGFFETSFSTNCETCS